MNDLNNLFLTIENYMNNGGSFSDIKPIVESYNSNDWINHTNIDTTGLYRNKILYLSYNIEILILTWKSNYETLPHDHSKNGCWLKVLKGKLVETLYNKKLEKESENELKEGEVSFMSNDIGYHSIKNDTNNFTFSMHIYSPPLHKTKYFSVNK